MSDIIQFEFGQPVEVALKFPEPKMFDGQYGERAMYSLTDGRVMYLDMLTAARIRSLGVGPGEFFFVRKDKNGRRTEWSVYREADQAPAPPARRLPPHELAKRLPEIVAARNAGANHSPAVGEQRDGTFAVPVPLSELEQKLADSIALVQTRKAAAQAQSADGTPRWAQVLTSQTRQLLDVYAELVQYASAKHGNAIRPDDIRALLTTTFINLSKGGNANAA
jgi:hypothetical protein